MKMEQTQCSETSDIKHHTPGNNAKDYTLHIHSPMKMEQTQCSETSDIKHHTPGNNVKGYVKLLEHGESLKSRTLLGWQMAIAVLVTC
jgi:hypothetical protein